MGRLVSSSKPAALNRTLYDRAFHLHRCFAGDSFTSYSVVGAPCASRCRKKIGISLDWSGKEFVSCIIHSSPGKAYGSCPYFLLVRSCILSVTIYTSFWHQPLPRSCAFFYLFNDQRLDVGSVSLLVADDGGHYGNVMGCSGMAR